MRSARVSLGVPGEGTVVLGDLNARVGLGHPPLVSTEAIFDCLEGDLGVEHVQRVTLDTAKPGRNGKLVRRRLCEELGLILTHGLAAIGGRDVSERFDGGFTFVPGRRSKRRGQSGIDHVLVDHGLFSSVHSMRPDTQ